eukprot:TRINITY_DN4508_c0_g1_i1.p1 TRINITY_DN4508_c0_g1~~TRINITY_DN4508_c0_g1_i1.p1  ORF type:complete len:363 (+),score=48.89 TRINITY_DN4508_c0_g1_i1:28-1116(+)
MSNLFVKWQETATGLQRLETEIIRSKELLDEEWPKIREKIGEYFGDEQESPIKKPNNSGILTVSRILDGIRRSLRSVPCVFVRRSCPKGYREYKTTIVWYRADLNGKTVNITWEESGPEYENTDYRGVFRGFEEVPHYVGKIRQKAPAKLPRSGNFSESAWRRIPEAWWLFALLDNRTLQDSFINLEQTFFDANLAFGSRKEPHESEEEDDVEDHVEDNTEDSSEDQADDNAEDQDGLEESSGQRDQESAEDGPEAADGGNAEEPAENDAEYLAKQRALSLSLFGAEDDQEDDDKLDDVFGEEEPDEEAFLDSLDGTPRFPNQIGRCIDVAVGDAGRFSMLASLPLRAGSEMNYFQVYYAII